VGKGSRSQFNHILKSALALNSARRRKDGCIAAMQDAGMAPDPRRRRSMAAGTGAGRQHLPLAALT
jgi:DNA-binding LacI/PurR family transcriptional regulator